MIFGTLFSVVRVYIIVIMKKTTIYRKPMKENLFEEEFTVNALSAMGNPLEQLSSFVDFEMFRPTLEEVLVKSECKSA